MKYRQSLEFAILANKRSFSLSTLIGILYMLDVYTDSIEAGNVHDYVDRITEKMYMDYIELFQ